MTDNDDNLNSALERIQTAFDPELLRSLGHRMTDLLGDHLATVENSQAAVLNWEEPAVNIEVASKLLDEKSPVESLADKFVELVQTMLDRGHNLHDPRYIGHQVPASIPVAGLFDAVGSVTNQVMAIYEMGPWATAVERALIDKLGAEIGWQPGEFSGLVTHGGSIANLTALLTARNVSLGDAWEAGLSGQDRAPVLIAHADAHYCIARSAGILGLGTNNVIKAALDDRRRIDPNRLDETISELRKQNRPIIAVSACACATPIGAFDPLEEIADVCQQHEVWLHVDAAHGGAACLSDRHRHLVAGLERADSFICDAHKMMFVPALCAFVFYKDARHRYEAFRQDAPYLFDPSAPGLAEYDSGLKTLECTKRAATFGLWGTWSLFGKQIFADMVDVTFSLGKTFYEKLASAEDFEPLHEPECNIVAFRYVPEQLRGATLEELGKFQLDIRRAIIRSGKFYIVPTAAEGFGALRVTIINPLTTATHLDQLMESIRETGEEVMKV